MVSFLTCMLINFLVWMLKCTVTLILYLFCPCKYEIKPIKVVFSTAPDSPIGQKKQQKYDIHTVFQNGKSDMMTVFDI